MGLTRLKNFCIAKETSHETKRQPTELEKIFANDMTNKGPFHSSGFSNSHVWI